MEINSHGLFSKWFSESGKLVVKMFQKIQELIDDPEALICILMDEVCVTSLIYTGAGIVFPRIRCSTVKILLLTTYFILPINVSKDTSDTMFM